jgi:hypothetical protein
MVLNSADKVNFGVLLASAMGYTMEEQAYLVGVER